MDLFKIIYHYSNELVACFYTGSATVAKNKGNSKSSSSLLGHESRSPSVKPFCVER